LLGILVYGYCTGVFFSRKLERATYDSVAFRYIASGSHPDHETLASFRRRFVGELAGLFVQVLEMADTTPMQAMTHRLSTIAGKAAYAMRKQTVEPVFGIIKSVMGFRQFSMRGLHKVTGEWNPVCLAWNIKRMAVLRPKVG